jgi:AraC family transcriptional regulator
MIYQTSHEGSYILHERAALYEGAGAGWLSIKAFFGGRARYALGSRLCAVDDAVFLVLNHGQPYRITIESETPVESFCLFFAPGAAEAALRDLTAPAGQLLADPLRPAAPAAPFVERTYPHDELLSPPLLALRHALASRPVEAIALEQQGQLLLQRLLLLQAGVQQAVAALPAARAATRQELYRRLHIARDYAAAAFDQPLTVEQLAGAAGLSPGHFLRTFKQVFQQTPYHYLTGLRLGHARRLLATTDQPITEICLAVGFESLGSFSWLFRRHSGCSPSAYRAAARPEKADFEEARA